MQPIPAMKAKSRNHNIGMEVIDHDIPIGILSLFISKLHGPYGFIGTYFCSCRKILQIVMWCMQYFPYTWYLVHRNRRRKRPILFHNSARSFTLHHGHYSNIRTCFVFRKRRRVSSRKIRNVVPKASMERSINVPQNACQLRSYWIWNEWQK